jgi:hypothetical protein
MAAMKKTKSASLWQNNGESHEMKSGVWSMAA